MKKHFLLSMKNSIKKQYPNYDEEKIEEIMYGVEGIYLTITKTIIIFLIAFIIGIEKELLILLLSFNVIRAFAFGMHASDSITCLIFSSLLFLGGSLLSKYVIIDKRIVYLLYLIALIIISIFSPADTEKRPLIKKKKRFRFKILSILTVIIYFICSLFIKNNLVYNCLILGLIIECILILPSTYKLFKMPYNNYKNYDLTTSK